MARDTPPIPELPDEVIEGLRQLVEQGDTYQFAVGDYLSDVVDEFRTLYEGAGVKRARALLIRQCANKVGVDASTLRDRECVARFYPAQVREEFSPLSYSQLRACKSAGEGWRGHAEWALENLPAPCALIRARIKHNGQLPPKWAGYWERVLDLASEIDRDLTAPESVRGLCRELLLGASALAPIPSG
jgi:hypothetical protein